MNSILKVCAVEEIANILSAKGYQGNLESIMNYAKILKEDYIKNNEDKNKLK